MDAEWTPNPRQLEFLNCQARECLYGGAAGGGKSDAMLVDAARYQDQHWHHAIIFRRTFPELQELILRSKQIYRGGSYNETKHRWSFKSGATVEFSYLKRKDDVMRYQGREFTYIGFEELTQIPWEDPYVYMISRLRSPKDGMPVNHPYYRLKLRGTTNPGGPGHVWVKKRFGIKNAGYAEDFLDDKTGLRRAFVPARIDDNPFLAETDYKQSLNALPTNIRAALLDGRWDVVAGTMFGELWNPNWHVVDPYPIPPHWRRWRGMDDGYVSNHCVVWIAQNPDTKQYVVYNEFVDNRWTPGALGREVLKRDKINNSAGRKLRGIIDSAAFNDPGNKAKSRADQMNMEGAGWKACSKSGPASRVARVRHLAQLLAKIPDSESPLAPKGEPGIVFFKNCEYLTETIPVLPIDQLNSEDVDTDADDHGYDALMYGLQAKFRKADVRKRIGGI